MVVGGGLAGLVAANRLAASGVATTLLEAGSGLGGRARTQRRAGFDLNQGPHALYLGGAAVRELTAMDIAIAGWNPISARSVLVCDGRPTRVAAGHVRLIAWLGRLLRRRDSLADLSAAEWLRREVRSESARAVAAALVRVVTYVAEPEAVAAEVAAAQLRLALTGGVRYLRGGWQRLVERLAQRAQASGVTIRTCAPVRGVISDAAGWAVALGGEALTADVVVIAVGGPDAFERLLGASSPRPPGPPAEVAVLDLGLDRLPRRNRRFAVGVDAPTYLSRHSPPEASDRVLLTVAGYGSISRPELETMADAVQPGWREALSLERYLPRMVAVSAVPAPGKGGLPGRPTVDRGEGLYLAGDWFGAEGWLADAAVSSAAVAAETALRRLAAKAAR